MSIHPHIPHPRDFLVAERSLFDHIGRALTTALGSNAAFLLCFIVPLAAIPGSDTEKLIVGLIFSNWFQAWALPILQKGQMLASVGAAAKADADHAALIHLSEQLAELHAKADALAAKGI